MNVFVALAIGYLVGSRSGGRELDRLGQSLKTLYGTDEFAEVVTAARAHLAHTLREVAEMVDGERPHLRSESGEVMARVRHLMDRD